MKPFEEPSPVCVAAQAAYAKSKQRSLFSDEEADEKQPNSAIVAAFRERLKKVAGFKFVPEPVPMTNSKNAVVWRQVHRYLRLRQTA
jgi:hypothetical protein